MVDVPQIHSAWEFLSLLAVLGFQVVLQTFTFRQAKKTGDAVEAYTTITGVAAIDARFGAAFDAGYVAGRRSCGADDVPSIPLTIPAHPIDQMPKPPGT